MGDRFIVRIEAPAGEIVQAFQVEKQDGSNHEQAVGQAVATALMMLLAPYSSLAEIALAEAVVKLGGVMEGDERSKAFYDAAQRLAAGGDLAEREEET